jgi:hypothetical protein
VSNQATMPASVAAKTSEFSSKPSSSNSHLNETCIAVQAVHTRKGFPVVARGFAIFIVVAHASL